MAVRTFSAGVLLSVVTSFAECGRPEAFTEVLVLTYRDFDELVKVCTYDDNWCRYADRKGKAIVYGSMRKYGIPVPEGARTLEVTVRICGNGWGEGLAVDVDLWTPNSAARIVVDGEVREERIPKLSRGDPHIHHHSYYKYEYGQSFSGSFDVSGKDSISLGVEMVDGARLDFYRAILTFEVPRKFRGLCYGPFRDNEDPDCGVLPTYEELKDDMSLIPKLTYAIRTYGVGRELGHIPELCQKTGVECYPGAWISRYRRENESEVRALTDIANRKLSRIKGLIVGNEVLLRDDMSEGELIRYMEKVRAETDVPVGTAETWRVWMEHPELAESSDFILVHIHPYWDGVAVEEAADYVLERWREVKGKYPGKEVIVGETGWPSQGRRNGEAVPGEKNQRRFLSDFLRIAEENDMPYFYFEMFDESWKVRYGETEAHWGLYTSRGSLKPLLVDLVPPEAREGVYRPPRELESVPVVAPVFVYTDAGSPENRFYPTGWMGDLAGWKGDPTDVMDDACAESPYRGDTCIRLTYHPGKEGWGGIYWQFPMNNWGDYPGYEISGAVGLLFRARGERGGEKAEFKVGGIRAPGKPYRDSFGPVSTGVVELTEGWRRYFIDLSGCDLSMVIGGFCWVTNREQNPEGCTIYVDEVEFVPGEGVPEQDDAQTTEPARFTLGRNYPNPFNSWTLIPYRLSRGGYVRLEIYDILGRPVRRLVEGRMPQGAHIVFWDGLDGSGRQVTSGVYLYRLRTAEGEASGRILVLR